MTNSRLLVRRGSALAVLAFLAACGEDDPSAPSPNATQVDAATEVRRLLIADAVSPTAQLYDLKDNTNISTQTFAGPASLVYSSPSGRFGLVQQRAQGRVNFIDGGVFTTGSGNTQSATRQSPARLTFELRDSLPTHESVAGNWISIFFDGSGMARWLDERDIIAGNPRVALEINSGGPQHSASATLVGTSAEYFVLAPRDPMGNILPQGVQSFNRTGQSLGQMNDCKNMHGNAAIAGAVIFGCEDGIAYVRVGPTGPVKVKAALIGSMAGMGVRNAYTEYGANFIVGQVMTRPGVTPSVTTWVTIEPISGSIEPLPLPSGSAVHRTVVDRYNGRVLQLTTAGALLVFNGLTRQLLHTIPGVVPQLPTSAIRFHEIGVADGVAYVASPYTGEVVVINTTAGTVTRRINVGGAPSRIAVLGATKSGTIALAK